jgi:RNA polymerase sigma-70 factor (ECF subfamily)
MQDIQNVVRMCQEGRLDAFNTLITHYQHHVYDLACAILRDETAAEDIVQETFLTVFQKIGGFKGESAFKTWLTAIAVNQCRMQQRKRNIRQFFSLEQLSPRHLLRLSGRQQEVADMVHDRQRRFTLWDMVNQLPDRLRIPMILRYRYELPCGDIAVILNLRTSTIYQQLNEGRRLLEQMQQQESRNPATLTEPTV